MNQRAAPLPSDVRAQLERLQRSALFAGSARLLTLLRFVVEETLGGCGRSLKETVIGNAVYGREPPYDPQIDSTVRVEAARLRRKLKEYYAGEGRLDPVTICLPTGGYVPPFAMNRVDAPPPLRKASTDAGERRPDECCGTTVAVMPIRSGTDDSDDDTSPRGSETSWRPPCPARPGCVPSPPARLRTGPTCLRASSAPTPCCAVPWVVPGRPST
jgi:hypothetical protein